MIQVLNINSKTTTINLPTPLAKDFWQFVMKKNIKNSSKKTKEVEVDFPEEDEVKLFKSAKKWKKNSFTEANIFFNSLKTKK
jgi:hypothetical protein